MASRSTWLSTTLLTRVWRAAVSLQTTQYSLTRLCMQQRRVSKLRSEATLHEQCWSLPIGPVVALCVEIVVLDLMD
eukprot:COSAG02_NODE_49507_length_326_cov_0.916300_1_plen_75_part_10